MFVFCGWLVVPFAGFLGVQGLGLGFDNFITTVCYCFFSLLFFSFPFFFFFVCYQVEWVFAKLYTDIALRITWSNSLLCTSFLL